MELCNEDSDIPDLLEFLRPAVNKFCDSTPQVTKREKIQIQEEEIEPNYQRPAAELTFLARTKRKHCIVKSFRKSFTTVSFDKSQPIVHTIFNRRHRIPKIHSLTSPKISHKTRPVRCPQIKYSYDSATDTNKKTDLNFEFYTTGTQTDIAGHETRSVFESKVRKCCPARNGPPAESNVFILLTDSTGESVFACNTKSAKHKLKLRIPNYARGDVLEMPKQYHCNDYLDENVESSEIDNAARTKLNNKINRHLLETTMTHEDEQSVKTDSADLSDSCSNILVLNISTQTTEKHLPYKSKQEFAKKQTANKKVRNEAKVIKPIISRVRLTGKLSKTEDGIVLHYKTSLNDYSSIPALDSSDEPSTLDMIIKDQEKVTGCLNVTKKSKQNQRNVEKDDHASKPDDDKTITHSTYANDYVSNGTKNDGNVQNEKYFGMKKGKESVIIVHKKRSKGHLNVVNNSTKALTNKSTIVVSILANNSKRTQIENRIKGTQVSSTLLDINNNDFSSAKKIPVITKKYNSKTNPKVPKINRNDVKESDNGKKSVVFTNDKLKQIERNISKTYDNPPKSNVKINIDSQKECYNVSIQHSENGNDNVTIRTIKKNHPDDKVPEELITSSDDDMSKVHNGSNISMHNLLLSPHVNHTGQQINTSAGESSSSRHNSDQQNVETAIHEPKASSKPITAVYNTTVQLEDNCLRRHFRGDNCSLKDPVQRDREIRQLLKVNRYFRHSGASGTKSQPGWPSKFKVEQRSEAVKCQQTEREDDKKKETKVLQCKKFQCHLCCTKGIRKKSGTKHYSVATQYCIAPTVSEPVITAAEHSVLDHKPKLEVCKHRPIHITQSEYEMIKQSVRGTFTRRKCDYPKTKRITSFKKSNSTVRKESVTRLRRRHGTITAVNYLNVDYNLHSNINKRNCRSQNEIKYSCRSCNMKANTALYHLSVKTQTFANVNELVYMCSLCRLERAKKKFVMCNTDCTVMTLQRQRRMKHRNNGQTMKIPFDNRRKARSTIEFHEPFACKLVTYSLLNVNDIRSMGETKIESMLSENNWSPSTRTLYKAGKKDGTRFSPNLGTSTFTLYSNEQNSLIANKSEQPAVSLCPMDPRYMKKNTSFFKKFVMFLKRRSKDVGCQPVGDHPGIGTRPLPLPPETLDSSMNSSYHINSSFEEMEISSSIYDTSASNFSQHSINSPVVEQSSTRTKKSIVKKMKSYLKKNSN